MGEKPGQSKFGTCLMISIVFAGVFGGMGFVQGSIGLTLLGINQVFTTTGYYISPAQWAMIGWPVLLLTIGLLTFITLKFYKFDEKAIAILDEKYYNEKLNELGPLGGSEYRWIIIVIALLTVMLIDFLPMNVVMLLFTAICLLPGIGFMTARDAFGKAVPWEIVFSSVSFPMVGVILANNGVISFLEAVVTPLVGNMHPFFLMLFICLMAGIINNALVSANFATNAIFVACMAPLVLAMGYNPAIILLPTIYMCSITVCLFPNAVMFINYNYGYWKPKDPILPGALAMVGFSVIACLFTYFLAPVLWGSSIIV